MRKLLSTLALLAAATGAQAADQTIDLSSGSASFTGTSTLLDGGDDTITFTGLAAGTYNFVLTFNGLKISGPELHLNGTALPTNYDEVIVGGGSGTASGPFSLVVSGLTNNESAYSGTFTVTAVPEPETYAMLLAGLFGMGFMAKRRGQR